MTPQNLFQIRKRIEHMNANTSIKASRFKQP